MVRVFIIVCLQAASCLYGQKLIPLKEAEMKLIPYKGMEVLIFSSTSGDRDTIWLRDIRIEYPDIPKWKKYNAQVFSVYGKFSGPFPNNNEKKIYGLLFEVRAATPDSETILGIHLKAKNAMLYEPQLFPLSSLYNYHKNEITIDSLKHQDVWVIPADTTSGKGKIYYDTRSNVITEVIWSKEEGLLQFKLKDGEVWTKIN